MDFSDLLFGGGEAIQSMFQLGFIPKEEVFREKKKKNKRSIE